MTQLFIAGVEAVLPQNFACTVKRENSFFTKSGEYTYDATLRLDNSVNLTLYGFLNRTNKSGQLTTDRTAVLIADGHVFCRGKEIITRWTEETVTIQIVSGESEMNYFIGQDKKIEELNLGMLDSEDYVYPVARTTAGGLMNYVRKYRYQYATDMFDEERLRRKTFLGGEYKREVPSPKLCPLLNKLIGAMGYAIGINQIEGTMFRNLFILNCRNTRNPAEMLAGWTVKDFLSEVEKLTGCIFVTDNIHKTCDIILKTTYYYEARQLPLNNVVDAYETEISDDNSREAEFTSSDVSYDLPDHRWSKLMKLPEGLPTTMGTYSYANLSSLKSAAANISTAAPVLMKDTSNGRLYICSQYTVVGADKTETMHRCLREVDQFADLDRDGTTSTLEIKMTPAPMSYLGWPQDVEVIDLGSGDGFDGRQVGWYELQLKKEGEEWPDDEEEWETEEDDTIEQKDSFEETIRSATKKERSAVSLYCAFYGGTTGSGTPVVYTDSYHAQVQSILNGTSNTPSLEGSLRLKDLEDTYYQGGYEIDTRQATTFETFDPNVADPRQVYVIRNRRYVVRDIEEVITAEGRQPMWKITCYPITISDEAIEKRWILTKGKWEDGAAWLDDGRWIDNPIGN
jgi:hypothetical protein